MVCSLTHSDSFQFQHHIISHQHLTRRHPEREESYALAFRSPSPRLSDTRHHHPKQTPWDRKAPMAAGRAGGTGGGEAGGGRVAASPDKSNAAAASASASRRGVGGSTTAPTRKTKNDDAKLCAALIAYGEYHANPWNQLIHLVCVPAILFSLLVALAYVRVPPSLLPPPLRGARAALAARASQHAPPLLRLLLPTPETAAAAFVDNPLPLAAVLAYALYYTFGLGAPLAGVCWTACVGFPLWLGAVRLFVASPESAWRWALYLHVAGWVAQIGPGHAWLEKRRPALVDSFWQAVATAPLFVFVEVMFFLGWNRRLRERVGEGVEAALRGHRKATATTATTAAGAGAGAMTRRTRGGVAAK
jgi:2-hydroxy fatty acid dioxygenase